MNELKYLLLDDHDSSISCLINHTDAKMYWQLKLT